MRTFLIIFATLFILSLPGFTQEKISNKKYKDQSKTQKHGQKDEEEDPNPYPLRKVEFGLNFGTYFANRYSANFYNGTPANVNSIEDLWNNTTYKREIRQALGVDESDTVTQVTVDSSGYPTNMHYNVGFMGGVFLRINFNRKNGMFLEANYAMLKTADVVKVSIWNPLAPATFDDYKMEQVIGKEGRVMIDLGYQRSFPLKSRISLFLQAGLTICYTQVQKSIFVVEGQEFNLINIYGNTGKTNDPNQQTFPVNQNAFGFGGFLGVGAGIPLTDNWGLEPGFFTHYYPTNLEYYPDFKPSFGLYLRILMFFGSTEE